MPREIPRVVRFTDPGPWDRPPDGSGDSPSPKGPSVFVSSREIGWTDGTIDTEQGPPRYYLHGKPSDIARINAWLAAAMPGNPPLPPFESPPETVKVPVLVELGRRALPLVAALQGGSDTVDIVDFVLLAVEAHLREAQAALAIGGPIVRLAWYRESRPEERPDWPQEEIAAAAISDGPVPEGSPA